MADGFALKVIFAAEARGAVLAPDLTLGLRYGGLVGFDFLGAEAGDGAFVFWAGEAWADRTLLRIKISIEVRGIVWMCARWW